MSEQVLEELATYSSSILQYQDVTIAADNLTFKIPEGAVAAGRVAGSTITISAKDVANGSGQFSWLAEQIKEHCPIIYKCRLGKKQLPYMPAEWQLSANDQLLLSWWNVSIRSVNITEDLLLLAFKVDEEKATLLPVISAEKEEALPDILEAGAAVPKFPATILDQVCDLAKSYLEKFLEPRVAAAMAEVEEQRQRQLDQLSTYYFLTSKRLQERVNPDEAQQRWQLESLAQDKARLVAQLSTRYSAESVMINISPEVVVLCGGK